MMSCASKDQQLQTLQRQLAGEPGVILVIFGVILEVSSTSRKNASFLQNRGVMQNMRAVAQTITDERWILLITRYK